MTRFHKRVFRLVFVLFCVISLLTYSEEITLLNVSYDPTRELYREINTAFTTLWATQHNQKITIQMSHGGSGKQARAVLEGLEADVVTLALAFDIDMLVKQRQLLPPDWKSRFPNRSCPYTSTIVFLVRKGNPKQIQSWDDLMRDDVQVVTPNPKTSGGARWCYLACWGSAYKKGGEVFARKFVQHVYTHAPVLDVGARGSTNTFLQGIGDVLLSWENEAFLAVQESQGALEIVSPGVSIVAEPPVAVVDKYAEKHGTSHIAKAYLEFLYTDEAQEIIAKHHYRPLNQKIFNKYEDKFVKVDLFKLSDLYPNEWEEAHNIHFANGGIFDQIMLNKK